MARRRLHRALLVALATVAGACSSRGTTRLPGAAAVDGGARLSESYVQGARALDLLFVIDNSAGMLPLQRAVADSVGGLAARLEAAGVEWRIGVVSTDLGIAPYGGPGCGGAGGAGMLERTARVPGCAAPTVPWLERAGAPDARAAFACIASLGDQGCGFERPLDAALRALGPGMPVNEGFLRAAASLGVVVVSNEDDCSAADPKLYDPDATSLGPWTSYRCFDQDIDCKSKAPDGTLSECSSGKGPLLRPVKGVLAALSALRPAGRVGLVAVAGPPGPVKVKGGGAQAELESSCSAASSGVSARPALRLHELAALFAERGAFLAACASGLEAELASAALAIGGGGDYCLQHRLRDPARPGCSVELTLPGGAKLSVPPSSAGSAGFHLVHPVSAGCASGALAFDSGARPPRGATVTVSCDFLP